MNERVKSVTRDALSLAAEDRALLMERLWDSLGDDPSGVPVPDWHCQVLAERRAAHHADPQAAVPWDVALEQIEATRRGR